MSIAIFFLAVGFLAGFVLAFALDRAAPADPPRPGATRSRPVDAARGPASRSASSHVRPVPRRGAIFDDYALRYHERVREFGQNHVDGRL